jgi:acetylornithine deacetylase/succinyl-diaminopimelate desuccinylase-like protein
VTAQPLIEELSDWLRIPSVSADPERQDDVRRAASWICELVRRAGGSCDLIDWGARPLVVGEIPASTGAADAPTVLLYGHFDVQPPDPVDLWETPPFEPTVRNGWLYARGAADDKGNLYMLLKAAEELASTDELPVNIRIACDGEEEIGGRSIVDFLEQNDVRADAAVIFDGNMLRRGVPTFFVATRGLVYFHVRVRTGERDLHSGLFGGVALNAAHALMQALAALLPRNGRLPEPLQIGVAPPTAEELAAWAELRPGHEALAEQGARTMDAGAARDFYVRTWAEPALDVHGIETGSPRLIKTVIPVVAEANLSIRLAPGQDVDEIAPAVERLLRESAPEGAEVELIVHSTSAPGFVSPDAPAVRIALDAFERVLGVRPLLTRVGGSLPIAPALAEQGIPTIITGFDLPEGNVHSPNERLLLEYLPLGIRAARELFTSFAALR